MKFPRNARLLRSPFDMAPFAIVFFLLVIFIMLATLLPTPGLQLNLPVADELPGSDRPTIAVAVDAPSMTNGVPAVGRYYYDNQIITETKLVESLKSAARNSRQPLTLIIQADKEVRLDQLVHLSLLARDAGIQSVSLATLPRVGGPSAQP